MARKLPNPPPKNAIKQQAPPMPQVKQPKNKCTCNNGWLRTDLMMPQIPCPRCNIKGKGY